MLPVYILAGTFKATIVSDADALKQVVAEMISEQFVDSDVGCKHVERMMEPQICAPDCELRENRTSKGDKGAPGRLDCAN